MGKDDDNVIFLAFENDNLKPGSYDLLACAHCRNKTFLMRYEGGENFPICCCAACGNHLSRMGFAPEEDVQDGA